MEAVADTPAAEPKPKPARLPKRLSPRDLAETGVFHSDKTADASADVEPVDIEQSSYWLAVKSQLKARDLIRLTTPKFMAFVLVIANESAGPVEVQTVFMCPLRDLSAFDRHEIAEGYRIELDPKRGTHVPFWRKPDGKEVCMYEDGFPTWEQARERIVSHVEGLAADESRRAQR